MKNKIPKYVHLGKDVIIGHDCIFSKMKSDTKQGRISFGDYCSVNDNCSFYMTDEEFTLGDYGIIHNNTLVKGYKKCTIGHNSWIGQNSIINSTNTLTIGNNFGIGAYSQIWTHAFFGELLLGCRIGVGIPDFESKPGSITIGDDFWGIGKITISPGVKIGNKVIALTNSLITKDVKDNTIVGGIPAKPIPIDGNFKAYADLNEKEKFQLMKRFSTQFAKLKNVRVTIDPKTKKIVLGNNEIMINCSHNHTNIKNDRVTYFDVIRRTYTKKHNKLEREFMEFIIGYKARFIPE